jgi:MFS family permease
MLSEMETIFYIGQMIGTVILNTYSDALGRRPLLLFVTICIAFSRYFLWSDYITGSIVNIDIFMFVNGFFTGAYICVSYTYIIEMVSKSRRSTFSSAMNGMWSLSSIIMTFIYYQFKSWRVNSLALAVAFSFSAVLAVFFIVEPPKYYLVKKNKQGFLASCDKIMKFNKDKE